MDRVLVVEDELLVRELLVLNLRHQGFDVQAAENCQKARELLTTSVFSLAILDVMLPDGDGFGLLKQIRSQHLDFPVLMLTARTDLHARVRALDGGADDYLHKPFHLKELMARVRVLLRRGKAEPLPLVAIGACLLDRVTGELKTPPQTVQLSDEDLQLLEVFLSHERQSLTRADLLEEAWGAGQEASDRLEASIQRLQNLLEPNPEKPVYLQAYQRKNFIFSLQGSP